MRIPTPLSARHGAAVLVVAGLLAMTGCSSSSAPGSSSAPPTSSPSASQSTSSSVTSPSSTPSQSPTSVATSDVPQAADVRAAAAAALHLYTRTPNNLDDPSAGYVWSSDPTDPQVPLSAQLRSRLAVLTARDWFSDQHCGENYIDGNQVGLTRAPTVVSAIGEPGGTVQVVLRGYLNSEHRDLIVVMSEVDGSWLATDLRRGHGADASIFSAQPAC